MAAHPPNATQLNCYYFLQRELQEVGEGLTHAPEAAGSALGTAAEIVTGAAGHTADKVRVNGVMGP